jgi:hypothetical protein
MTTNRKLSTQIDDDKQTARVSIDGTLTTAEIETLIADLAVIRAHMLPPAPDSPYEPASHNISVQKNASAIVGLLRDGNVRFWMRNIGIGWLAFDVQIANACAIRDYLVDRIPADGTGPSLFDKKLGDGDPSH